jgi:hypothetical protein
MDLMDGLLSSRTNMLLLVGGIPSPEGFSDSSVVMWDHAKRERVWEIALPSQVKS